MMTSLATNGDYNLIVIVIIYAVFMFSYERICSVLSGDCVSSGQATTYVVVGSAGKELGQDHFASYEW